MSPLGAVSLWTGWDPTKGAAGAETAEPVERPHVAAGGVRFELLAVAGRGFRPPRYLTVAPSPKDEDASAADASTERDGPLQRSWSVAYRSVAETAPEGVAPFAIYLLGVNPPADATEAELEVFNDFYTSVHLREVAERRHALRAERHERVRVLHSPAKGAPRYLAIYEVDEAGASQRRHVGPPYSAGPAVWQRHTTPWRLWYRRIAG